MKIKNALMQMYLYISPVWSFWGRTNAAKMSLKIRSDNSQFKSDNLIISKNTFLGPFSLHFGRQKKFIKKSRLSRTPTNWFLISCSNIQKK